MIDHGFAVDAITDRHVHGRRAPSGPASALCTDGTHIALLSRRTDTLPTGPVGDAELPATAAAHPLVLPDGSPLPDHGRNEGTPPAVEVRGSACPGQETRLTGIDV